MPKTIAIVGFGPGTATAVAEKFGGEGFSVALIGRDEQRLAAGVSALNARGITAFGFEGNAGDPASIRSALRNVRSQMGPIAVLQWNAYSAEVGDLLAADSNKLQHIFDVAVFGLLAAAAEVRSDLKAAGDGAILVSNGALGDLAPQSDAAAISLGMMDLALSSAAKHKLVGLLAASVKADGIFVGDVMVYGVIKNSGAPNANIDPATIAQTHWDLYRNRDNTHATVR